MLDTELHVQVSVWKRCQVKERRHRGRVSSAVVGPPDGRSTHAADLAVLVMEGEVVDRSNGSAPAVDALYWAALSRGLALATDLDLLDLRPVLGWQVVIDGTGAVTVNWTDVHPLLTTAPVDLPPGGLAAATALHLVVVVAGYGLSLSSPDLAPRLTRAAWAGARRGYVNDAGIEPFSSRRAESLEWVNPPTLVVALDRSA